MNIFETLVLGLVQGLTEFIPVSSSGHLVLVEKLFSGSMDHLFIEFINFGTLFALLIFFRHRLIKMFKMIVHQKSYNLALNLLITSLPVGILGFFLADVIETSVFFKSVYTVSIALMLAGLVMIYLERIPKLSEIKSIEQLSHKRALMIGLTQVFALIPGVSRSGSTIIAGRIAGLTNKSAAEYSFLASIPVMIGVSLKLLIKDGNYLLQNLPVVVLSNLVAFAAGMIAIRFMLNYLNNKGLAIFGWYRVGLASVVLITTIILN